MLLTLFIFRKQNFDPDIKMKTFIKLVCISHGLLLCSIYFLCYFNDLFDYIINIDVCFQLVTYCVKIN